MTFKGATKAVLRRFGFDLVRFPPHPPLALTLMWAVQSQQINLVLDVGGCRGAFCDLLRRTVGYRGRIVSFEPCTANFREMVAKMRRDSEWEGLKIGLSNVHSSAAMNTYGERGEFNSLLPLRAAHAHAYNVSLDDQSAEQIELRTLDELWPKLTADMPTPHVFLKVDTQGHDAFVLAGASQSLRSVAVIQLEMPAIEVYDGMTQMSEMIATCQCYGFVPIAFHPVDNVPASYRGFVPEFDVILARPQ
jgi:FkbM family methyltransferase